MKWINANEKQPPFSGDYLCAVKIGTPPQNHYFISRFEMGKFSFDERMKHIGSEQRVYAWAEIAEVPNF